VPKLLHLRFADRLTQGPHYNLVTVEWARNRLPGCHTHDYPEIFWITQGECEHLLNGGREHLETGAVYLLRAADAHQLLPWRGRSFSFTNLSISPAAFLRLRRAYPDEAARLYPESGPPCRWRLSRAELELLDEQARRLSVRTHSVFHLDHMVLGIWDLMLRHTETRSASSGAPDWLQQALLRVQEPEIFSRGVPGLVQAAGRCHEHVSRACRRHLGRTPTQIVNTARLRHAAHALRMTSRSVSEIALDCGFENPAQLHRLFRAAHGTTPGRYRRE
jgi:AraC family cel operon transcriptional repressor